MNKQARKEKKQLARQKRALAKLSHYRGDHRFWTWRAYEAIFFLEVGPADKTSWGDGPWQNEPDLLRFEHSSGLKCLIRRADVGSLCGYVSVPKKHPFRRLSRGNIPVSVHGGLTWCEQIGPDHWIGFDCAHFHDYTPGTASRLAAMGLTFDRDAFARFPGSYRDLAFVRAEVEQLAEQVHAARGE